MMEELRCEEAWAFDKVSTFGRYAKQAILRDYPARAPTTTTVHFRGRSCEAWAQKPTLRRALQDFLRQHPQHRPPVPRDQGISRFAVSPTPA